MPCTDPAPPALGPRDIVRSGLCIGCGACAAQAAGEGGRMALDVYGQFKPAGPAAWRERRSTTFAAICPFSPAADDEDKIAAGRFPEALHKDGRVGHFQRAYVGHASEGDFRGAGSSGGMVTWTAAELLRLGIVDAVVHVSPTGGDGEGGFFRYGVSRSVAELRAGSKSRYHPVELSGVLREIAATPGRYALVGIPCFIKAANLARAADPVLHERIVATLGLYCGHMKSLGLVESFAWQMGQRLSDVRAVDYRLKDPGRPANWYTALLRLKDGSESRRDWWHLADGDWGAGFFQNSACDFCDDVVAETADIAFGDAWVEPYASDGRGTNVVVVRSPRLDALVAAGIAEGRLALQEVDADFIVETQAGGFRQRREGLAWRLATRHGGLMPRKRVAPQRRAPARRKAIYATRRAISVWSHRMLWLARRLGAPWLYIGWARTARRLHHMLAYSRG
jgi:coenzyme F420-reducing hydrogenase beta subunit